MKRISVPYIDQTQRYPTGCESVSAVMLLNYLGYDISVETFIDKYLPKGELFSQAGCLFGPHPEDAFIGSPYNRDSYGCYAPCIAAALRKIVGSRFTAAEESGKSLDYLFHTYLDRDMPVVFWATINMEPSSPGTVWQLSNREGSFQWINHEHCLLLVGYDENACYFNDPWENKGCIGYDRILTERRYRELGCQAVGLFQKGN